MFDIVRAGSLRAPHGFFGNGGGLHQFGYGGPGDRGEVARLREAAAKAVKSGAALVCAHQVHSPDVVTVTEAWPDVPDGRPKADALVTALPGLALGIITADCTPVLLADEGAGVIGAAHAGWRGAQGGVLENTIDAMVALGAERSAIVAAIGPTIAQPSYEVDAAFREHFGSADELHFAPAPERGGKARWLFDLPGYVAARLRTAGLSRIEDVRLDTLTQPARYHSYRRSSQRREADYGRQISIIALP